MLDRLRRGILKVTRLFEKSLRLDLQESGCVFSDLSRRGVFGSAFGGAMTDSRSWSFLHFVWVPSSVKEIEASLGHSSGLCEIEP